MATATTTRPMVTAKQTAKTTTTAVTTTTKYDEVRKLTAGAKDGNDKN